MNLLNYIDRQVLFAVFPLIQEDFQLTDTQMGILASIFIWIYLLSAPPLGYIGDRTRRFPLISAVVGLWSIATAFSGFARSYAHLLWARAAVGIGEAGYGALGPPVIADLYPSISRGRALSVFFIAIPAGSALGYILGGQLGAWLGWRPAFWIVGFPGVVAAVVVLLLKEPKRGASDESERLVHPRSYAVLLKNRTYVWNTLAMTALTFVLGGLAAWIPTFLVRAKGLDIAQASTQFGLITLATGIVGTLTGGFVGDRWLKTNPRAYPLLSAFGMLSAVPFVFLALYSSTPAIYLSGIFVAEFLIFLNNAPLNAIIVSSTSAANRGMAFGVNILVIHALGDALSPVIIGRLSDLWGITSALAATAPIGLLIAAMICLKTSNTMRGVGPRIDTD